MNNEISLQQAVDMTTLFRQQKDQIVNPSYVGKNVLPTCETFDRAVFDKILSQPSCVQMRIYYGLKMQEGVQAPQLHAIIVGVNGNGEDILPPSTGGTFDGTDDGTIGEDALTCPPICPPPSPLNP